MHIKLNVDTLNKQEKYLYYENAKTNKPSIKHVLNVTYSYGN